MKIMVAYDDSRNARLALAQTVTLFKALAPQIVLISVVEEPRSNTSVNEDKFNEEYEALKTGANNAARLLREEGLAVEIIIAEGDARKMILRATKERVPDLLVIARHSNESDTGLVGRALTALVDEIDYMTFGSVSSFLARRVECPLLILPSR
ncbi:universal stress protein UspA [Alkalilimnicola ehrlichii]|uniref:Universal stress protein UspA n=1 Tax=Alkalilimnicola ehrlichii TaxID=351052 RepID=A0A3E0WU72_9GAMM|nr:universal stress protein [Alkalilimnicola ehrlichii]RFA29944.1 universal stress protein UspA [Alkalilimnicola ehrlichii]RFA36534.1 universal stress protein UspA [Alkalilimnicola ehrlichii]